MTSVATIDDLVAQSLERPRSLSLLVAAFALVALVLSAVSVYGVMAFFVEQNERDISICLALGGSPTSVARLVLGQALVVVLSGIGVGLLAAYASTRLFSRLLFGVSAADVSTFVAVALFLLAVALLACSIPVRRALGLEPAAVLRNE